MIFIDHIPPGTTGRALDAFLHGQMYERERKLKKIGHDLIAEVGKQSLKPEEYTSRLNEFLM